MVTEKFGARPRFQPHPISTVIPWLNPCFLCLNPKYPPFFMANPQQHPGKTHQSYVFFSTVLVTFSASKPADHLKNTQVKKCHAWHTAARLKPR